MPSQSGLVSPSEPAPQKSSSTILQLAVLVEVVVFVIDLNRPPGLADWVLYVVPVIVCLFASRPWMPLSVAAASTLFLAIGFIFRAPGMDFGIARANREIGAGVIWLLAIVASRFVASRNRIQADRWLEAGRARLADAIRSERDPAKLAEIVLSEVCNRLDARVGALFVSRDGSRYELAGGYAVSPERAADAQAFKEGEGLVGQVVRDGRQIRISDVPAGYADVSSGLGATPPRHLLLAPLLADGGVKAVLELGFMEPSSEVHESYLASVGDALGAAFQSAHHQEHLSRLLEESRKQAELVEARGRDLVTINDELEAQSQALQESHVRLEEQQVELEQTNQQLEEQAEALQRQREIVEERNVELVRAQLDLVAKTEQLERASRYKSEFLANMSHELRTPLNSSLILSRLLADNRPGNLTPEQVKFAETVHAAGTDLLTLINDVLDLSKVEAGKMEIRPSAFVVGELVEALDRAFRPMAEDRGLAFNVSSEPRDAEVYTDRSRLEQILRNLLSNALKFTDRGEVELCVVVEGGTALFRVRDTGIGVAEEQLERIFEAFHQEEAGASRRFGGTGLGLSIGRHFATLIGGEIRVESVLGAGSTFTVRIPQKLPEEKAIGDAGRPPASVPALAKRIDAVAGLAVASRRSPPRANGVADDRETLDPLRRTILVIEDDDHFAFVLHRLARDLDLQCLVAGTGTEGLELAAKQRPDAIILDIKLPDQSGLSVLDQLKSSPETRHIPVHVLSVLDYAQTAREMGAHSYMLKPANQEEIVKALSELTARAKTSVRKVLVVEDSPRQRVVFEHLVELDDVRIVGAKTAKEALERLSLDTFDCVILDLGLPDMSGFELLETMASGDRFAHPPTIVHTGRDLSAVEEARLQRYARAVVLKGARSPERLLHEVTLFLHRVERRLSPEHQRLLADVRDRDRALEGRRILLVDDDVRSVYALTSVLQAQRADVRIARDGREALLELERDGDVDLVLMDVMMPVMNGYEAMECIRAQERFAALPIIALTARAMANDHERCLRAGANDYIAKPVQVEQLVALLRVWVARHRTLLH